MLLLMAVVMALVLGSVGVGCGDEAPKPSGHQAAPAAPAEPQRVSGPAAAPTYIGTDRCSSCHAPEAKAFTGSHHDRAMEAPSQATVEAPFDGQTFTQGGVETSFQMSGEHFTVRTQGPDGERHDYPVAWTFGFTPLQQFLLDVGEGRLQSLTVAWDARPAQEGGQRYFSLYPEEDIPVGDPLHWSGEMQNWNYVCADCHSTNYRKSYDLDSDAFTPTWAEADVGCEACHGPGSSHEAWAQAGAKSEGSTNKGFGVSLANGRAWQISAETHNALPQPDAPGRHAEVDTCAPCHSRRHQIAEGRTPDQPLLDFYRPELLEEGLYHADGQIQDEVYVYGSFVQSRMFHAGVRCSDCHEPHTLELRAEGDALCGRCHDQPSYAASSHHRHQEGGSGSACIDCHMPTQLYMGVDQRHDHALQKPNPVLAAELGTPSACQSCHRDQSPVWIAERSAAWWGTPDPSGPTPYGLVIAMGRQGGPGALAALTGLADDQGRPAIVRGTALRLMQAYGAEALEALTRGATDPEPLVRLGAIYGARGLPTGARLAALISMINEPLLALRTEAARTMAMVSTDQLPDDVATKLESAREELLEVEALHSDRADAWLRIGVFELERGRPDEAETALHKALAVAPNSIPVHINLADLARARGDENATTRWLEEAAVLAPDDPDVAHARGLLAVRTGDSAEALVLLALAAKGRPEEPRYAYVYAVALWSAGRYVAARAVIEQALVVHPASAALLEVAQAYASDPSVPG